MMADALIDLAFELARREVGRPKAVSLRRAVSTAYYALFHSLASLSADALIGWRRPCLMFNPVYRSLDHARARNVLNRARQQGSKGSPTDIIALAFATLQDARYDADYNPEPFRFNRSGTIELIDVAEQAIEAVKGLSTEERLALAVELVFKPR